MKFNQTSQKQFVPSEFAYGNQQKVDPYLHTFTVFLKVWLIPHMLIIPRKCINHPNRFCFVLKRLQALKSSQAKNNKEISVMISRTCMWHILVAHLATKIRPGLLGTP